MGKIIDNRADFNEWLKTLQPSQRQMWNHPRTLQRHFAAAMRGPKKTAANATKDTLKDELRKAYAELAVLRAEKEKDLRGKILLVDLAEDTVPSIVKTMMSNPKALRDPRKMADLGSELRRAARGPSSAGRTKSRSPRARAGGRRAKAQCRALFAERPAAPVLDQRRRCQSRSPVLLLSSQVKKMAVRINART